MDHLHEEVLSYIISQGNSKIKDVSIDDYFGSYTKTELFNFLSLYRLSMKDVIEAYVLENKSKKELIKYIGENVEDILKINFNFIKEQDLDILRELLPNILEKEFDVTESRISLSLVKYLKIFNIAKFECGSDYIKMFIPKEIINTLLKLLKSKRALKDNKKYNDNFNYLCGITKAYGIIDFETLFDFFNKDMYKIKKDDLEKMINSFSIANDDLNVYEYSDTYIICEAEFIDEEMALQFYESQIGEYVSYELDEIMAMNDGSFIKSSTYYGSLINFLNDKFDLTDEDLDDIFNYFVQDYVFTIDPDEANNNFLQKADEMFYVSDEEIEQMRLIVERIYLDYPKWIERGKI